MLTGRQLQYLEATASLCEERGGPVHYSKVAEVMGVTKWTAHDVLSSLAKAGYLDQDYQIRREERSAGRSSVLFFPTKMGQRALEEALRQELEPAVEDDVRTNLLAKLDEAAQKGIDTVLKDTFEELPRLRTPLAFCANLVLILVLCIWIAAQRNGWRLNLEDLPSSANEEALLVLLAGLTLGIVFKGRSEAMRVELAGAGNVPAGGYLQLALQDNSQRTAFLGLVEMATKRISSEWSLTGEEERAVLMSIADRAMSGTLLN